MSTDNDFVARLRIRWDAMGDMANDERAAAATEIERLRSVVEAWKTYSSRAERDIVGLREERDEARRYACDNNPFRLTKWQLAKIKGWDCFDLENGNA